MQVVVMHQTGGPEVLSVEEGERPEPGEGEVLVRVRAIGINPIEWKIRRGLIARELPVVLGSDISGTVEGSNAEGFAAGDAVFGFAASGGYAEYATSPAAALAPRPAELSDEQAAGLPVPGLTAWQGLFDHGSLQRGQTVLVAGAAGGVGHIAVQLAKHVGATVIGTASARNRDHVLALGADRFIDYTSGNVAEEAGPVDLAFDTVGGETTASLLPAVRDGGTLVTIAGGPPPQTESGRGVRAELMILSPKEGQLAELGRLAGEGSVKVDIAEVLPLAEVGRAHEMSESGHTRGKLILTVD